MLFIAELFKSESWLFNFGMTVLIWCYFALIIYISISLLFMKWKTEETIIKANNIIHALA